MFVLKDEVRTARKFYPCDASELWCNYGPPSDAVTADDRLVLDGVKADKWKIRPGQRYRCVVFRDGRELVTQRAPGWTWMHCASGTTCTTTLEGVSMSREAFGDPPESQEPPQVCPVCGGEWHAEHCEFGKEVARRLKAERDAHRLAFENDQLRREAERLQKLLTAVHQIAEELARPSGI